MNIDKEGFVTVSKGILVVLGSVLGSVLFLFVTFFFFGGDAVEQTILNAHGYVFSSLDDHKIPVSDAVQIKGLIEKGYVVNTGDLIGDISNFYSSIIEFLVVIIGVLGVVAFMYVRAGSESVAEAQAIAAVEKYFESQKFYELLKTHVLSQTVIETKELKESLKPDLQIIEESMESMGLFEERLVVIEEKLASIDSEEMEGAKGRISIRDEGGI
ncbi:MAG: hypothetical protein FHK82_00200 [Sedimenticola thiotaurini]|uniref:Uncharacterized protein n=1 Tax=Sedimenticola thiotaurini TaxID=1543721 RepID=A0A558DGM6_9GAMM|nr:MAG: hypothetical protein FHK82_00200 [Sedimenticola thiotaurini]